ncbi:hypothetical protein NMD1_01818 [Novosphingobium sp. MD-1]|nr:hypothetical protein NMD1_01818 [Novosphingobium sp. MD-1]
MERKRDGRPGHQGIKVLSQDEDGDDPVVTNGAQCPPRCD